jgi:chemotaxis signal transduction protein
MSSEPRASDPSGIVAPEASPLLAFADHLLAAQKAEEARSSGEVRQFVTFWLREEEFAVSILHCREILRPGAITRIPEAPAQVRGVVNLRGRIVPAVDVRVCLGIEPAPVTARSRLIVVEVAARFFALLVDRISRTLKLASSQTGPVPQDAKLPYLAGMAQGEAAAIPILDIERMLLAGPGMRSSTDKE